MHQRPLSAAVALVSVLAPGLSPLHAQSFDQLECHKVSAHESVQRQTVDVAALQSEFSAHQCTVLGTTQLVCIAAKTDPSPAGPAAGAALTTAYSCYKLRCRSTAAPVSHLVSDGLVSSVLTTNYRVELVCLPAVATPVSATTTSTTTTTLPPCDSRTPGAGPLCAGGGCAPGFECGDIGAGRCGCVPTESPLCGTVVAPQCGGGRCPSGQKCGQAGLGLACACIDETLTPCGDATAPACDGFCPAGMCITLGTSCLC